MAAPKKKTVLTVTAPLVQVRLGDKVIHLFVGDVVPEGASDESIAHLKSLGYLAETDAPIASGE